ncbi:MAG: purine-nucleoside phosphorylase [Coriobacteriales bacterium]|jgi:purine-nucleoside phosphorylase|nr:purine-nucleoside phosphorylase [Coriobacteriales bacterium]
MLIVSDNKYRSKYMTLKARIRQAVNAIKPNISDKPDIAIICGSGLGSLVDGVDVSYKVPYAGVPNVNPSGAPGHAGVFVFGTIGARQVVCMQGRLHAYEGNSPEDVVMPLYVAYALGARTLIVTNASGGINGSYEPGDAMLIKDHINLMGSSPLTLCDDNDMIHGYPDMTHTYSKRLRKLALDRAKDNDLTLHEGIYIGVRGPQFETPAEIRAYAALGADAVGMSTVYESIVAHALGMDILGISLISNKAAGLSEEPLSESDITKVTKGAAHKISGLVNNVVGAL